MQEGQGGVWLTGASPGHSPQSRPVSHITPGHSRSFRNLQSSTSRSLIFFPKASTIYITGICDV